MKNSAISLVMLVGFLMVSASLFAHHGTGVSYDMHKTIVSEGSSHKVCLHQSAFPTLFRCDG